MARVSKAKRVLTDFDLSLADDAARFFYNPTGFTRYAYPWGEVDSPLAKYPGPDAWQIEVMDYIGKALQTSDKAVRVAISSGHGVGKAQSNSENILTEFGWKAIGNIQVGEKIFSADGTLVDVIGVFPQGERDLFRVTLDDGCSLVVDGEHLWYTTTRSDRKHGKEGCVKTTAQIAESLTFPNGSVRGLNHCIPTCQSIQHHEVILPIDPYLLGFWLGDGCKTALYGLPDAKAVLVRGFSRTGGSRAIAARPHLHNVAFLDMGADLRRLGLFDCKSYDKFIPSVYLHSSHIQRVNLLQGVLDSDGTIGKNGGIVFDTASIYLADGISELVRSLGGVARRGGRQGRINGVDKRWSYRVYIALPDGVLPFRHEYKRSLYTPDWGHKNRKRVTSRFISSVEPVGRGLATCIAVNHPSQLYIAKDHIVTHNTSLFSFLISWFMATRPDANIKATANTKTQLQATLWRELALWHKRSLFTDWFDWMATSYRAKESPETWVANAIPWSVNNAEAFAGMHGKHVAVFFDEASGIDDVIWETIEGAFTTGEYIPLFVVAGNPTRSSGGFYRCFHDKNSPWKTFRVDSRTARMTNKAQLNEWVERWGIDSNFSKVRIYGQFPTVGDIQFIPTYDIDRAMGARVHPVEDDYLVFGVDVARRGSDSSIIFPRRSNVALPPKQYREPDLMRLASLVADEIDKQRPDTVFVDGNGLGAGLIDRLRQLGFQIIEVIGQSRPIDLHYYNKRAECYGGLKEWLRSDVSLPNDNELQEELVAIEYDMPKDRILLENKDDIRERLGRSPDKADALALTFAEPVNRIRYEYHANTVSRLATMRQGRDWRNL